MTAQDSTPQFQFPGQAASQLPVPPQPAAPANHYIMEVAKEPETRHELVCKNLLPPASLEAVQQEAVQLYPQMLSNTAIFIEFGNSAVAGLNALINRLLKDVGPMEIPELTTSMKHLNDDMRGIKRKYDTSDPEVRKKLENWSKGFSGLLHRGRTMIDMLMEDATSMEQQIDRVKAFLAQKQQQLLRNVLLYDELYAANEEEIKKVMGVIAVMEVIADLAAEEMAGIAADPHNPLDHDKLERKRLIAEFKSNLEVKITEFKNRLFVGWTTSPQVTNMRTLDIGLAQRIYQLQQLTIPVMLATVLQWRMMIQTEQGARMQEAVAATANEWLTEYAQAGAQAVPRVAQTIQTPTLSPATIAAMADSVDKQAQGIIDAYESGKKQRADIDDAIVRAQRVIQDATARVSDAVVDDLVASATRPLSLPAPAQ